MKLRVTFDVDTIAMFDMLQNANGNCAPIGERLVTVLMTGKSNFLNDLGMAYYGVTVQKVEPA